MARHGIAASGRLSVLPLLLLGLATAGLGLAQAQPRPGQPLALIFPPGMTEGAALLRLLAEPGWDPVSIGRVGPFALVLVAPTRADPPPVATGAWLVLPAIGRPACAGSDVPVSPGR
ncbi:hypothetical protein [Falsiroseomonas sp.]|uniref:hypothetical protein n=1 Tax=Falsiroseomonas sp. TaxID=2870721 RepID=UPI003F72911D